MITAQEGQSFSVLRWTLIALFLLVTILTGFFETGMMSDILTMASILFLFVAIFLHGIERYGIKNTVVFFVITWFVSNFFEALSIQVGFPFGHYFYDKMIGPRIYQVPILIMFAYFGMGYASWVLSHVLLGQYNQRLSGNKIFLVPFVGTFIMVIWDLCMDPISSTIGSLWVWRDGGSYFGVPLQNYFGWFIVVFIFMQIFAIYISKYDASEPSKSIVFSGKVFWMETSALYGIQGLAQLLYPITFSDHMNIYGPMALVTIFTMMFVTLLSFIKINQTRESQSVAG